MRRFMFVLAWLCLGVILPAANAPTANEDKQIEFLLAKVAAQADVQFVRNGTAYDASKAVSFLRGKWDRQRAEVKTVRDFIDKVATKSSTTGRPYLIKFKDGHTVECREFLNSLLITTP